MKRRLFNAGAMVSLVLCVAVTVLWIRSIWRFDSIWAGAPSWFAVAASETGTTTLILHREPDYDHGWNATYYSEERDEEPLWRRAMGRFEFNNSGSVAEPSWEVRIGIPHWSSVLITSIAPTLWARRRSRRKDAECPACGYDLRGTPGSECPECGAAPGKREAKA